MASARPKKPSAKKNRPAKTSSLTNLQKNIDTIVAMEKESLENLSAVEHIAEKVTVFAGSTPFIILHIIWFALWIAMNTGMIPGVKTFDPFPFSFLTLVVSLEAIFLTLLVLMSQNRMTKEADKRAQLDLQINLLDEQETTLILRLVKKIAAHAGIEAEDFPDDLSEETDVTRLAKTIDEKSGAK